jgi:hypothetical protein
MRVHHWMRTLRQVAAEWGAARLSQHISHLESQSDQDDALTMIAN